MSKEVKKELKQRFVKMAASINCFCHHLDFRSLEDFDDEAFAYVMMNAKGVNMLNLNESDITNESIQLFTRLEYVNEIRVKGCHLSNNDCVIHLNKLTTPRILDLVGTVVTIDGQLNLTGVPNPKLLTFSTDNTNDIQEKWSN